MTTIAMPAPATASNRSVANTPPRLADIDLVGSDRPLLEALHSQGAGAFEADCRSLGRALGSAESLDAGFAANEHPPEHVVYDRSGARVDEIEFHPAWHRLLRLAVQGGVAGAAWADERPGAHVARAAKFIAVAQAEAGITCPLAMTSSCVPALRLEPRVAALWEPLVTSGDYDPRPLPRADKRGALIGMALTEKQGGSDVRASTTVAEPLEDGLWRVTGQKWFVSAVQSDALFVLAQTREGITCLLVPRRLEDGTPNGVRIDRLKSKLGNRSNPTAEIELDGSVAWIVGDPGHGVRAIMTMIAGTRQDCVLGSTAVMRLGTAEAIHWCEHRAAFGRSLVDQPAMASVLADLALETEAATWAALRLARANEEARRGDPWAAAFGRLASPVLKYWICKRAPVHAAEALECLGGFGYIEESRLARAYREAPLMSVWEGSGNVQALDVLRALTRDPESAEAVLAEVRAASGANHRLDAAAAALRADLAAPPAESRAREIAGRLARALQASLLVRHAPHAVADAFCATRLGESDGAAFGTLPPGLEVQAIIERHRPVEAL